MQPISQFLGAVGAVVLALAASLVALAGPEPWPSNETLPQYATRLLGNFRELTDELYAQTLLSIPGLITVGTSDDVKASSAPEWSLKDQTAEDRSRLAGLRQDVARDESEIGVQQEEHARRYAELREEVEDSQKESVILPEHPDDIRQRMGRVDANGAEMRCSEAIPTHSSLTTRGIELQAKSSYQGRSRGGEHSWKYIIKFINHGQETVQMLTRHWVFVDADGKLNEVKGPGARGVTPVLPPAGEWSYESGTSLATPLGSMYGSFQFEVLRGDRRAGFSTFSARVARLLLSAEGSMPRTAPCAEEAAQGRIPLTSVLAVERVILGGRADYVGQNEKGQFYRFKYDVQFNNARDAVIDIVGHSWEVVDSDGNRRVVAKGEGVGGSWRGESRALEAGDAFRTQGVLSSLTPDANAQGTYTVLIRDGAGASVEIEARTDWMGLSADSKKSAVENFVADPSLLVGS